MGNVLAGYVPGKWQAFCASVVLLLGSVATQSVAETSVTERIFALGQLIDASEAEIVEAVAGLPRDWAPLDAPLPLLPDGLEADTLAMGFNLAYRTDSLDHGSARCVRLGPEGQSMVLADPSGPVADRIWQIGIDPAMLGRFDTILHCQFAFHRTPIALPQHIWRHLSRLPGEAAVVQDPTMLGGTMLDLHTWHFIFEGTVSSGSEPILLWADSLTEPEGQFLALVFVKRVPLLS